jgi:hypothetical protein
LIIALADETLLWKYDLYSNQWYILDKLNNTIRDIYYSSYYAFFYPKDKLYVLLLNVGFDDHDYGALFYSLEKRTWSITKHSLDLPFVPTLPYMRTDPVVFITKRYGPLIYAGKNANVHCDQSLWELQSNWLWSKIRYTSKSPVSYADKGARVAAVSGTCFGSILYVLVRSEGSTDFQAKLQLWRFQLDMQTWDLLHVFVQEPGAVTPIDDAFLWRMVVVHGSILLSFYTDSTGMRTLAYDTENMSGDINISYNDEMMRSDYFCIAPLNSSAFLFYGARRRLLVHSPDPCYLWIITLQSASSSHLKWLRLPPNCEDQKTSTSDRPPTEDSHFECVVVNDTFIIIGGKYADKMGLACYRHVWYFSMISHSWERAFSHTEVNPYSSEMCVTSVVSLGPHVVVMFRTGRVTSRMIQYELWFYVIRARTWIFHSNMVSLETFIPFIWTKKIFLLSTDLSGLSYKTVFCPSGYSSRDISQEECKSCPKGFYALGEGEKTCISCPPGLVTASTASSSISNCSLCKDGFCLYGRCLVLYNEGTPQPFCQCRLGFSGPHCTNPKTILIAMAIVVAVVAILVGLVCVVHLWRKRKVRERRILHHVEELVTVWQIGSEEISRLERIGAGGYGEVYRARYRDMSVAMKVLRVPANDSMMREFEREIKFMQTVRHPNIVLFLGAGRTSDGSPFLISEFVSRGSLRDLLDDYSQVLSVNRKVTFCLDIAHGMNFLHSLTPPRVHRDLKSDNLLISETDVVKIADFGLGKQLSVSIPSRNQRGRAEKSIQIRRRSTNQESDARLPLLDLRGQDSPHALGAAKWRAPELSISGSTTQYTTAADVYSFGIVMWEIVTRRLPFESYEFNYEVLDAVKRGERPALSSSCPYELETLIRDCWRADPGERPSFGEIESRLTAINE